MPCRSFRGQDSFLDQRVLVTGASTSLESSPSERSDLYCLLFPNSIVKSYMDGVESIDFAEGVGKSCEDLGEVEGL